MDTKRQTYPNDIELQQRGHSTLQTCKHRTRKTFKELVDHFCKRSYDQQHRISRGWIGVQEVKWSMQCLMRQIRYEPSRSLLFDAMVAKCQSRLRAMPLPLTSTGDPVQIPAGKIRCSGISASLLNRRPVLWSTDARAVPNPELGVASLAVLLRCERASLSPLISASENPLSVGLIIISGRELMRCGGTRGLGAQPDASKVGAQTLREEIQVWSVTTCPKTDISPSDHIDISTDDSAFSGAQICIYVKSHMCC